MRCPVWAGGGDGRPSNAETVQRLIDTHNQLSLSRAQALSDYEAKAVQVAALMR